MTAYLVANPPRRAQYRKGRRAKPTGTIVLHTAENAPDLDGPDPTAENMARFIAGRTDAAGSYHLIGDRDSHVQLVPFDWEAFHDGTGSNPWSIGISLACKAAWFRQAPDDQKLWYMARLATMARLASDWLQATHGITVPVRRLTKASATEPGFCSHQDRETWFGKPGRRTDPWGNSDPMWHLFLSLYEDTASTTTPAPQEDDDVKKLLALAKIEYAYRAFGRDPHAKNEAAGLRHWIDRLAGVSDDDAPGVVEECEALLWRHAAKR
jgi:hypothetical protein